MREFNLCSYNQVSFHWIQLTGMNKINIYADGYHLLIKFNDIPDDSEVKNMFNFSYGQDLNQKISILNIDYNLIGYNKIIFKGNYNPLSVNKFYIVINYKLKLYVFESKLNFDKNYLYWCLGIILKRKHINLKTYFVPHILNDHWINQTWPELGFLSKNYMKFVDWHYKSNPIHYQGHSNLYHNIHFTKEVI